MGRNTYFFIWLGEFNDIFGQFKELDARINSIGSAALQIGDRLETLDGLFLKMDCILF